MRSEQSQLIVLFCFSVLSFRSDTLELSSVATLVVSGSGLMPPAEVISHALDDGDLLFPTESGEPLPVSLVRSQQVGNIRVSLLLLL